MPSGSSPSAPEPPLIEPSAAPQPPRAAVPRLQALARRLARRYHVPGCDREDLVQEALVVMLSSPLAPEAHLVVLVRRRLSALVRRAQSPGRLDSAEPLDHEPLDPSRSVEDLLEDREQLDQLLSRLSPQQQLVIELGCRRGLKDEEIASALETTVGAVRSARSQAIAQLRRLVAREGLAP